MQKCFTKVKEFTCIGILPSAGYRTQFRHIFMTMSSRNMTISCVQYCSRQGLLVNTADGNAVRTSSVIQSGIAGLPSTDTRHLITTVNKKNIYIQTKFQLKYH